MNLDKAGNKKKILLVSNGFYPEISPRSYRATELAREFCRQGHKVVVITKNRDFDYSDFLTKYKMEIKMWGKYRLPRIPVLKAKPFSFLARLMSRILLSLFEYPDIEDMFKVRKMLLHESGYDLMISFAVPYPAQWGTAWSRTKKNRIASKWIADCGDPYMGDVLDSFRKLFYFSYLEKWFCRKADYISIPVESAKPGYYPEFHEKIVVIPQGFDFNLNEEKSELPCNDVPTFAYAGALFPGYRDPEQLLQYLMNLDRPFRFLVFTNKPELFKEYIDVLGEKLDISEYIPRDRLMEILSTMDFLINFDNNTSLNSPSKLIDYAITNRPVLNIRKSFEEAPLLEFLKGDYNRCLPLPDRNQYHIKNVSLRFLDL